MSVDLTIPELGESVTEVFVTRWLKQEGDAVEKDQTIAELESEKASFELPAPATGTLASIDTPEGESAQVGQSIGTIEEGKPSKSKEKTSQKEKPAEKKQASKPTDQEAQEQESEEEPSQEQPAQEEDESQPKIMPAARRALKEHDLSADEVKATGPSGRLLKEDVLRHVERRQQQDESRTEQVEEKTQSPPRETPASRDEELVPMSPMRRTIARHLVEAQSKAALLTTFNEIDMSAVVELRQKHGEAFKMQYDIKLGFTAFFVKACVDALKGEPALNAEIREDKIAYRNYYDIGVAVSTEEGLVVPVIRGADRLSFAEIERTLADFAARAKDNQLELEELRGGTFTITNGGVFGSLLSTPIVNPPQSGVLGLHAIQDRPVAIEGQVVIRPMMYVALTYDHRIVDGKQAVTFLRRIRQVIETPSRMLIEI